MPKRTVVIYNPVAGRGRAKSKIDQTRAWAVPDAELLPTQHAGHAVELARSAAEAGFGKIIAAGGDGTVHEVANGILQSQPAGRRPHPDVVFGVWPLGSSNDYAFALGVHDWFQRRGKGFNLVPRAVDVGRIVAGDRERFFVNGCGFGFNGMVALEARGIRRIRGTALYSLAFVRAMLWHYCTPDRRTEFDQITLEVPTLSVSVNLGIREGGFAITPQSKLDDGLFDTMHVGTLARWRMIRYLPSFMSGKVPTHRPELNLGTCRTVRSAGAESICIHTDGEIVCRTLDGIRDVEIKLLPRRLLVDVPVSA